MKPDKYHFNLCMVNNNNKTCNAHISTLLGVQGVVETHHHHHHHHQFNSHHTKKNMPHIAVMISAAEVNAASQRNWSTLVSVCPPREATSCVETQSRMKFVFELWWPQTYLLYETEQMLQLLRAKLDCSSGHYRMHVLHHSQWLIILQRVTKNKNHYKSTCNQLTKKKKIFASNNSFQD